MPNAGSWDDDGALAPRKCLARRCHRKTAGGLDIEKPLTHGPDAPLIKQALLNAFAHEDPHGPGLCTFFRAEVEEARLRRSILTIAIEFAEWVVGIAAIGIDEPEMGLPQNGS
ncbi:MULTISPECIES: hypothetical protein [unclassified Bradyrhizobium]|uniref:hypothetical protein n=1 Tax=unclassified Bradyrhizobium TaxID=2631580 RepID=UPI0028F0380D|nr:MULTISPECIES: hypothetical protein [unclassified Bradyrhizobium]